MAADDKAEWGNCRWGNFRWGVKNRDFDDVIEDLESEGNDCDVTRRKLSLGARDATTNWRAKSFAEDTVKAVYIPRGSSQMGLKPGTFVRSDALLIVCAGFKEGDEVETTDGKYWEVKAIREHSWAPNNFSHREVDLTYLPYHT